jgi:asparagine synthase (glutamine-hydrolysing)
VCGIAGFVGTITPEAPARLAHAMSRIAHRGPDGRGTYQGKSALLGMTRLAIVDVAGGHQPIYNEDQSIAVVCNGELYEYVERLRELEQRGHRLQSASDINQIPHLYEESGPAAFGSIRGMFAAALWDERKQRLLLARDRAGKKPLYYAMTDNGLAFSSEIPSLLALLGRTPGWNPPAIADYLRLGFVPHPETVYRGVFALPPGSTLCYTHGEKPEITAYWSPREQPPFRGSRADAIEQIAERLREAVRLRLRSDVPMGLFLSGGIDSGLIGAYAAEEGARDLLCFTVKVADARLDESHAAIATASKLGLPIEIISLDIAPREAIERVPFLYGQPFADSSAVASFFVARAARQHRKVVLNGDGGDEVFAGYRRYWAARAAPTLVSLGSWARTGMSSLGTLLSESTKRRTALGFVSRTLRGVAYDNGNRYLAWTSDLLSNGDMHQYFPDLAREEPTVDRLNRLRDEELSSLGLRAFLRSDFRLILADDLLVKMDIATMANSLEARSPLLDIPLVEFAWSLPEKWLISARETKPLLRELARRVLPRTVASAPKRGFEVPIAQWLARDLRDTLGDTLLASDSRVGAMGDPVRIRALVDGRSPFTGNRPQVIWALLMLELFLRNPVRAASGESLQ